MYMRFLFLSAAIAATLSAQLPEGPGMQETNKNCSSCHEIERSISLRQDINGWNNTITKMVGFGMKASQSDLTIVSEFLAKHYPADAMPPINVNTASAIELESRFTMKRSQSAAFLAHREKIGKFKTFSDLKQAPGIDPAKIEAKKTQIVF